MRRAIVRTLLLPAALTTILGASPLCAQRVGAPVEDSMRSVTPRPPGPVHDVRLLGGVLGHTLSAPVRWDRDDVRAAGAAAAVLFALSATDEAGRSFMRDQRSEGRDRLVHEVERLGTVENFYVLGAFYAVGWATGDVKARSVAVEGLASSGVAAGVITPTLQRIIGRSRPRAGQPAHSYDAFGGSISFPSGHTTQAFAVASVIAAEYPHPAVQLLSYGLAASVAAGRMYEGAHFISDVTGAALIGTAVGHAVVRYGRGRRVQALPAVSPAGGAGVHTRVR